MALENVNPRRGTLFVLPLLLACSSAPAPAAPASSTTANATPGSQCVAEASAERAMPENAPASVEVAHILVRHADVADAGSASRSREDACLRAEKAREELGNGASWDDVVERYSDAPGATSGGLGRIKPDEVDPAFAAAAFGLASGELSFVVETKRGYHLIFRTD